VKTVGIFVFWCNFAFLAQSKHKLTCFYTVQAEYIIIWSAVNFIGKLILLYILFLRYVGRDNFIFGSSSFHDQSGLQFLIFWYFTFADFWFLGKSRVLPAVALAVQDPGGQV
jgi:hypothetical protein